MTVLSDRFLRQAIVAMLLVASATTAAAAFGLDDVGARASSLAARPYKAPAINLAGKFCIVDENGHEYQADKPTKTGLYYRGECGAQDPGK